MSERCARYVGTHCMSIKGRHKTKRNSKAVIPSSHFDSCTPTLGCPHHHHLLPPFPISTSTQHQRAPYQGAEDDTQTIACMHACVRVWAHSMHTCMPNQCGINGGIEGIDSIDDCINGIDDSIDGKGADIFNSHSGIWHLHHAWLARYHRPPNTDCDPRGCVGVWQCKKPRLSSLICLH